MDESMMSGGGTPAPAPAPAPSPAPAAPAPTPSPAPSSNPAPTGGNSGGYTNPSPAPASPAGGNFGGQSGTNVNPTPANNGGGENSRTAPQQPSYGIRLVVDKETGRRRLEQVAPDTRPTQPQQVPQPMGAPDPGALPPNIRQPPTADNQQAAQTGLTTGLFAEQKPATYTDQELKSAILNNSVDESRIPDIYKQQYTAFKQERFKEALKAQLPNINNNNTQNTQNAQQAAIDANRKFYSRVNAMANEQAMRQVGITQDELDAAEYSDDENLLQKVEDYHAALQNARGNILARTREKVMEQQRAAQAQQNEKLSIYNDIRTFTENAQKNEPNFAAIDQLMATRYQQMPYQQAKQIAAIIEGARNGNITRQGAEQLQQYYEDTRKAYYAKVSGAGVVPTHVSHPPAVETSGAGDSGARAIPDPSKLRTMTPQQRTAWFQTYFRS